MEQQPFYNDARTHTTTTNLKKKKIFFDDLRRPERKHGMLLLSIASFFFFNIFFDGRGERKKKNNMEPCNYFAVWLTDVWTRYTTLRIIFMFLEKKRKRNAIIGPASRAHRVTPCCFE